MTWSHPRGYDPMVAASRAWATRTGVEITWEKRSLQEFESFPVRELAAAFDLIVIDHPHVGQITRENCLVPLDVTGREAGLAAIAAGSVGASYQSYTRQGRQWALPIDAAAQVLAYRADLIREPPRRWSEVVALARAGKVALPLKPPHSLMVFFTLCANLGRPCHLEGDKLVDGDVGREVLAMLQEIAGLLDRRNFQWDPIDASEAMARADSPLALMPLGYGYANYAVDGFRERHLTFADIAVAGTAGPVGATLGGTGIAVSAFSGNRDAAMDYAYWIAGGEVQRGLYAAAGGQPSHALAWANEKVNAAAHGFYRNTRDTLEGAWVRPRHNGYMAFQQAAGERLTVGLLAGDAPQALLDDLNRRFAGSF
jgi:multiple sugar transport system substrate-binding protein